MNERQEAVASEHGVGFRLGWSGGREDIFGNIHFLFVIPILFTFSMLVIMTVSRFYPAPDEARLENTVFSVKKFQEESRNLKAVSWWNNYRVWGLGLISASVLLLVIFS